MFSAGEVQRELSAFCLCILIAAVEVPYLSSVKFVNLRIKNVGPGDPYTGTVENAKRGRGGWDSVLVPDRGRVRSMGT